ncbi:hypothetical protein BOTCAL_0461g00050 [Botryotinia calthae]|uniref:Uncharacterized protein n=1 Tax=Botryotinia calthae TaxID=38488 RepID=A0A4Y8CMN6_9HELO|nr:hypothetical protein BOTCAL_0461g00050 [Botryotinia calthae]
MSFQIPETKAEQNYVYALGSHLSALPQSHEVSSHYLERKEWKMKGLEDGNRNGNGNAKYLKKMTKQPSNIGPISNSG